MWRNLIVYGPLLGVVTLILWGVWGVDRVTRRREEERDRQVSPETVWRYRDWEDPDLTMLKSLGKEEGRR